MKRTADENAEAAPHLFDEDMIETLFLQLNNLIIFATLAARGSAAAAARSLSKSISAVTRAATELETALGLTLADRSTGSFQPTPYGRILLNRVERIEAEIAQARAELARFRGSSAGLQHLLYSGRKLRLLNILGDAGTVSGAATMLDITQAGVSMALSRIEGSIGIPLFRRTLNGIFAEDAGVILILCIRRIHAELRHVLSELASLAGTPSGTIVVGTLPMGRADILPRAIANCLKLWPGLRVQVVEASREGLIAQLRSGDVDALLSVPLASFDPRGLIAEPLFADELVVVAGCNHPLAAQGRATLEDVAGYRWVLPWANSTSRTLFDEQFARAGVAPPKAAVQTGDLLLMRRLLAEGEMLAFTSLALVQYEIAEGTFVRLDIAMESIARDVVLLRRDNASFAAAADALLDEIRLISARG